MTTWFEIGLSNALAATALAALAWVVSRLWPRPRLVFAVWVLVLAKLVAPPLVALPLESLRGRFGWSRTSATGETDRVRAPYGELPSVESLLSVRAEIATPSLEELDSVIRGDIGNDSGINDEADADLAAVEPAAAPFEFQDTQETTSPAAAGSLSAIQWALGTWLAGSTLWFALAAARIARFRRLLRFARPAPQALEAEVGRLAARMNLRRVPEVRLVRRRVSPLVWAMTGRATILLPSELLRKLSVDERATLLAHELAHLKRRDHLVRLLELAALGMFWWHPVAWWARRNAERAAEHCCDAQVIELFPAQARAYALALWATVDFLSDAPPPLPLGASGFSQARHVKRRMEMILANTTARRAGRPMRILLLAIGLAVLPLSLRSLWAEPPAQAVEEDVEGEVIVGQGLQSDAPLTVTVVEKEQQVNPAEQSIAYFVGTEEIEEQNGKPAQTTSSVEERIDRLEKMIQALAKRPAPGAATESKPQTPATTKTQTSEKKPRGEVKVTVVKSAHDDASLNLSKEDVSDLGLEASHTLADIVRQATLHLELSRTNYQRFEAASRQAREVKKAFEADTVSLDQVLEAQRRVVEAYLAYVRETAALEPNALERRLVIAKAGLTAMNRTLKDARETWKQVHQMATPGSAEEKSEARAREQYYQLKAQASTLLDEYLRAQAAAKAGGAHSAGKTNLEARKLLTVESYERAKDEARENTQAKLKAATERMNDYLEDQRKVQAAVEQARHEADAARRNSEEMLRYAQRMQAEAEVAAEKAKAAAQELAALKAAQDAAQAAEKPERQ